MSEPHRVVAIVPTGDIDGTQAFYELLGFAPVGIHPGYRILSDGMGAQLHLREEPGWPPGAGVNPFGLYFYVADVDAVAARVKGHIIPGSGPRETAWGTYEFAVSDPTGTLVRIGRATRR